MTENHDLLHNIDRMEISIRLYNCLRKAGMVSIHDLARLTEAELSGIPGLGRRCFNEAKEELGKMGLCLSVADPSIVRPKAPPREGRRFPLNMSTTKVLHDRLDAEIKASGRSLAQEVEYRLERSFLEQDFAEQIRQIIREELHQHALVKVFSDCISKMPINMPEGKIIPDHLLKTLVDD